MIQGDPHPIAKFRVIGPLSNMPEFAHAFSCKAGLGDGQAAGAAMSRVVSAHASQPTP